MLLDLLGAQAWIPLLQQVDPSELQDLVTLLDDREAAIKQGMRIAGQRYEVIGSSSALLASQPASLPGNLQHSNGSRTPGFRAGDSRGKGPNVK